MDIFNNDHEVLQLGSLTIENHPDCVVIAGDVEIGKNIHGKAQAAALYDFAKALVARFDELDDEPESTPPSQQATKTIQNPFA